MIAIACTYIMFLNTRSLHADASCYMYHSQSGKLKLRLHKGQCRLYNSAVCNFMVYAACVMQKLLTTLSMIDVFRVLCNNRKQDVGLIYSRTTHVIDLS